MLVVLVVIWRNSAGLHEQHGVIDGGGGLNLHEDPAPQNIHQRVCAGIDGGEVLVVGIELKLVGERAKALVPNFDLGPVCHEDLHHIPTFGVLAVEVHLQQVLPGDHVGHIVKRGDCVLEPEVNVVFLQSEKGKCQLSEDKRQQQQLGEERSSRHLDVGPTIVEGDDGKDMGGVGLQAAGGVGGVVEPQMVRMVSGERSFLKLYCHCGLGADHIAFNWRTR